MSWHETLKWMCALSLSFDCWVNTAVKLSLAKRRQNAFRPALRLFILRQQSTEAAMMINFNMEPQSQWPCRCFHNQLISALLLVVELVQQRCWFVIILKLFCAIMTQHQLFCVFLYICLYLFLLRPCHLQQRVKCRAAEAWERFVLVIFRFILQRWR